MPTSQDARDSRHQTLVLLCVSVPSFMISLDANIIAVSLPSIARSLGADFAAIEWVVSAYTLAFASLLLAAGSLADRYGRKRVLLIGLAVFTVASFACGAATSVTMLNAARAVQGIGAALQLSAALATLSHAFRGPARARAFAFWGSVIGIAISLGPIIGGFLTQQFGWEWAFYVNIPVGIAIFALALHAVEESSDPAARRIDVPGLLSFSASLFLLTLALISANHAGWSSRSVRLELAVAALLFLIFLLTQLRQAQPMIDLRVFRNPTYVGACLAGLAYAASMLTMLNYLPLYLQSGLGYGSQAAGLLMLPMALPLFVVPRLVAVHLTHRLTGRALLTIGLALVGAGMLWLAFTAPSFHYPALLGGMLLAGIGAGILNGETAKVSMSAIPPERAGMGSGIGGTIRFTGIVVGFAALGTILFARVAATVATSLPASTADRAALIHSIVAGDLAAVPPELRGLALLSFGHGYQAILFAAAAVAVLAAVSSWLLIRAADTATVARHLRVEAAHPLSAE